MGSFLRNLQQTTCSRSPLPLPWWLSPLRQAPPPMVPLLQQSTRRRSSPPSLLPMSMESTMTTARPTSRRLRPRMPTTKYTADHVNGFVAEVSYEGTPVYPPEPAEGYGHAAPVAAYAPAPPVYKPAA